MPANAEFEKNLIKDFFLLKRGLTNQRNPYPASKLQMVHSPWMMGHHTAVMMSVRLCATDDSCTRYQDKCYYKLMQRHHGPMVKRIQKLVKKVFQNAGFRFQTTQVTVRLLRDWFFLTLNSGDALHCQKAPHIWALGHFALAKGPHIWAWGRFALVKRPP